MSYLLTLYLWTVTGIAIFPSFLICSFLYPFVEEKTVSRVNELIYGNIILYSMTIPGFWEIEIRDHRKDKSWNKNYVIVPNHLSFIDSLVMGKIPLKKKFMIAKIFTKIPLFGWLTSMSGFVTADLHDPELNKTAVERAISTIKKDNSSFCIYPEGKRERQAYKFETFKTGCFRIARGVGYPILPITLKGTEEGMGFGGIVKRAKIVITVDEPFYVENEDYSGYILKTQKIMSQNFT